MILEMKHLQRLLQTHDLGKCVLPENNGGELEKPKISFPETTREFRFPSILQLLKLKSESQAYVYNLWTK